MTNLANKCNATVGFLVFPSDKTWTDEKMTVPAGVTSLRAVALVMSDNLGLGFTPLSQKVTMHTALRINVPNFDCQIVQQCFAGFLASKAIKRFLRLFYILFDNYNNKCR